MLIDHVWILGRRRYWSSCQAGGKCRCWARVARPETQAEHARSRRRWWFQPWWGSPLGGWLQGSLLREQVCRFSDGSRISFQSSLRVRSRAVLGFAILLSGAVKRGFPFVFVHCFISVLLITQGCPSWKWYFPYHYAPFASDFQDILTVKTTFERNTIPVSNHSFIATVSSRIYVFLFVCSLVL